QKGPASIRWVSAVGLVLLVVQVIFGTDVREVIDHLKQQPIDRSEWIDSIGSPYDVHRILAYFTLGLTIYLYYLVRRVGYRSGVQLKYAKIALVLVVVQMLTGIVLARFSVPAYAQTLHLVIASLLVGAQYYLLLLLNPPKSDRHPVDVEG